MPAAAPVEGTGPLWWLRETARTIAGIVGGRLLFVGGMALVGLGGTLLSAAWRLGPEAALEQRGRSALTERVEVRATRPFWRFEVEREPFTGEISWPTRAVAELCAEVEPAELGEWGSDRRWLLCGGRRRGGYGWNLTDGWQLAEGVPIRWPVDELGWPQIELRFAPEVAAELRSRRAWTWPLLGQSDEARDRMTQPGSEWEALQIELDRPVEWLVRSSAAPAEARFALAVDPRRPDRVLPASLLDSTPDLAVPALAILVLAAAGGLAWTKGIAIAFHGPPLWVRIAIGVVPLLLLPWWGERFAETVRRLAPGFGEVGLALAADLDEAGRPPVEVRGAIPGEVFEPAIWSVERSYYRGLLLPLGSLPTGAGAGADEALRATCAAYARMLAGLDSAEQAQWLARLAWEEQLDRGAASLFFAPGALALLEDPERPESVRRWAASFLFWHGVTPLGIHPEQPAFAARRAIWEALHRSADPAVRNTAGFLLERLTGGAVGASD